MSRVIGSQEVVAEEKVVERLDLGQLDSGRMKKKLPGTC